MNYFWGICFCKYCIEVKYVIVKGFVYNYFNSKVILISFVVFIYFVKFNSSESFFICRFDNIISDYFFYNNIICIFFLLFIWFLLVSIVSYKYLFFIIVIKIN